MSCWTLTDTGLWQWKLLGKSLPHSINPGKSHVQEPFGGAQAASVFCSQSRDDATTVLPVTKSSSIHPPPTPGCSPSLPPPCTGGDGALRAAPGLHVLSNVPVLMLSERPLESSEPHKWKPFTINLISLTWKVFKVKSCSLQ